MLDTLSAQAEGAKASSCGDMRASPQLCGLRGRPTVPASAGRSSRRPVVASELASSPPARSPPAHSPTFDPAEGAVQLRLNGLPGLNRIRQDRGVAGGSGAETARGTPIPGRRPTASPQPRTSGLGFEALAAASGSGWSGLDRPSTAERCSEPGRAKPASAEQTTCTAPGLLSRDPRDRRPSPELPHARYSTELPPLHIVDLGCQLGEQPSDSQQAPVGQQACGIAGAPGGFLSARLPEGQSRGILRKPSKQSSNPLESRRTSGALLPSEESCVTMRLTSSAGVTVYRGRPSQRSSLVTAPV